MISARSFYMTCKEIELLKPIIIEHASPITYEEWFRTAYIMPDFAADAKFWHEKHIIEAGTSSLSYALQIKVPDINERGFGTLGYISGTIPRSPHYSKGEVNECFTRDAETLGYEIALSDMDEPNTLETPSYKVIVFAKAEKTGTKFRFYRQNSNLIWSEHIHPSCIWGSNNPYNEHIDYDYSEIFKLSKRKKMF